MADQMKDKKQVLEFAGLGGYIRKQRLEEFLAKKFGRQIRVEVRMSGEERILGHPSTEADKSSVQVMNDHLVFYVPEKVPDVSVHRHFGGSFPVAPKFLRLRQSADAQILGRAEVWLP